MTFPLFYQKIRRTSRLVEHSEPHEHYDKWVVRRNEHPEPIEEIHTSAELFNILNRWFRYIEDGDEGEERDEGHGWYFKFLLRVDGELIDITEHMLNHFDKLKDKLISGDVK
jgi:hypothetical protein